MSLKDAICFFCDKGKDKVKLSFSLSALTAAKQWRYRAPHQFYSILDDDQMACIEFYKHSWGFRRLDDVLHVCDVDFALASGDTFSDEFERHLPIVKLLMTALHKLPLVTKPLLLCGQQCFVGAVDYKLGTTVTWWQFVFTTTDTRFRTKHQWRRSGEVLFYILGAPAVDVTSIGEDHGREEWIVLPGTSFTVESITVHSSLTTVLLMFTAQPQEVDLVHPGWRAVCA